MVLILSFKCESSLIQSSRILRDLGVLTLVFGTLQFFLSSSWGSIILPPPPIQLFWSTTGMVYRDTGLAFFVIGFVQVVMSYFTRRIHVIEFSRVVKVANVVKKANVIFLVLYSVILFVPLVPYKIQSICGPYEWCPVTSATGFWYGYKSLGSALFNWGASLSTTSPYIWYYSSPFAIQNYTSTFVWWLLLVLVVGSALLSLLPVISVNFKEQLVC